MTVKFVPCNASLKRRSTNASWKGCSNERRGFPAWGVMALKLDLQATRRALSTASG